MVGGGGGHRPPSVISPPPAGRVDIDAASLSWRFWDWKRPKATLSYWRSKQVQKGRKWRPLLLNFGVDEDTEG